MTCSSLSPVVDDVRPLLGVPILKIDEAMAEAAVSMGSRIGVIATARSALLPVCNLVRERAESLGRSVEVTAVLLEGVLTRLQAGDTQFHDAAIVQGVRSLAEQCDTIVFAQGSMARALDSYPESEWPCPILTNAQLGLERAARWLQEQADLEQP
jgi:Asp/Glu/hydantoin racemase